MADTEAVDDVTKTQVNEALERILASEDFAASPRLSEMLSFVVQRSLEGRTARLKAFNIAHHVFGRDESFDATTDPLVRVQASRLRKAIERYYLTTGAYDRVRISIPKGGYAAKFSIDDAARLPDAIRVHSATREPTIAVVPFDMVSDGAENSYFARGITVDLATRITEYENLHVINWYSTDEYDASGKDYGRMGNELGARFVLSGTVQRENSHLHVSASLIDSASGEMLWSKSYDRELSSIDILQIQDEIARQVVARLADRYGVIPRLLEKESKGKTSPDLEAYDAVLRFYHYNTHLGSDNYQWAKRALEHAIRLDPDYSLALASLAELSWDNYVLRYEEPYDCLGRAYDYARRAVASDPESQAAWYAMAFVSFLRKENDACLEAANRVLELSPKRPYYIGTAGFVIALAGEWQRGLDLIGTAKDLNPFHPTWLDFAPFAYHYFAGEYEQAIAFANTITAPGIAWDPLARMNALFNLGRNGQAVAAYEELRTCHPDFDTYARDYIGHLIFKASDADSFYETYRRVSELAAD